MIANFEMALSWREARSISGARNRAALAQRRWTLTFRAVRAEHAPDLAAAQAHCNNRHED